MISFGRYSKTIVAVVTAIIAFATVVVVSPDSAISSAEWLGGAVGLAGALGVYSVNNNG